MKKHKKTVKQNLKYKKRLVQLRKLQANKNLMNRLKKRSLHNKNKKIRNVMMIKRESKGCKEKKTL